MNIKRLFLSLLSVGLAFHITAQTADTTLSFELCLDTSLVNNNLSKITYRDKKVYKSPVPAVNSVRFMEETLVVTCINDQEVVRKVYQMLQQTGTFCESNQVTTEHLDPNPNDVSTIQLSKYDISIDEFLNIEDSTIFTTNFKHYNKNQIHPRSYKYYCLIAEIHQVYIKMESLGKLNWKEKDKADKILDEMYLLFENIKNFKTEREEFLSPSQQVFYKNQLESFKKMYYGGN